jgi:2-hydroxy-6-oxonona-2,4-dienedioate hydrolase
VRSCTHRHEVCRIYNMKQTEKKIESKWAYAAGRKLRYQVPCEQLAPDAPAIVMVHGLVVSSRYLIPTMQELAPYYRVYAPELPGYGKSQKPDDYQNLDEMADTIAEWMTAIGLPNAILLGNSLGCQIIAHFSVRHPQRIQSAILLGPTMDVRARTARQEIGRWLVNLPSEPLSLFPIVLRDYLDIGFRRFAATFRHGLQDKVEAYLPRMHIPTLVVRGSRDTVVPQRWAEEVTRLLPQGKLVVIDKAAHDVNYNSPVQLSKVIREFLA